MLNLIKGLIKHAHTQTCVHEKNNKSQQNRMKLYSTSWHSALCHDHHPNQASLKTNHDQIKLEGRKKRKVIVI